MTTWAAALAVVAVLVWPGARRPWPAGAGRRPGEGGEAHRGGTAEGEATVSEVADALVLLALVLRGGTGQVEAVQAVAAVSPPGTRRHLATLAAALRWGVPADEAWALLPDAWRSAGQAWSVAAATGSAPATALEEAAGRVRSEEDRRVEAAVARSAALLVLPLGLCFLPAFAASTVVPLVMALLGGAVG